MWTFLMMLVSLFVASALATVARRTYLRDVATAAASMEAVKQQAPPTAERHDRRRAAAS